MATHLMAVLMDPPILLCTIQMEQEPGMETLEILEVDWNGLFLDGKTHKAIM